jgi:N-acetylglucosaminyl-diphospho-decaprenol L-rhamnosyltransferase
MELSIIIVNYNVKYFLEQCLLSVVKACGATDTEILVVDNNSTDGSREYLFAKFPTVKFYWSKENPGFGRANNSMLSQATGDYILFLNPDTIVPEDCFTKCISFFRSHTDCGALGVRMTDGSGNFLPESKRSLPAPLSGLYKITGLAKLFPRSKTFASYYDGSLPEKENNKAKILSGAFMMLSRKAIEATSGFDEDFFMYGEDIDLSYRIMKSGFNNYYLGKVTIIHFKGESTQKKSAHYAKHFYGAMKLFVDKHYGNNVLKKSAMHLAISSGRLGAVIKQKLFLKTLDKDQKITGSILIVAAENQISIVQKLLNRQAQIVILTDEGVSAEEILQTASEKNCSVILLCEGKLNNKFIIDLVQSQPGKYQYLFYENGAQSIVGSSNKNTNGFVAA